MIDPHHWCRRNEQIELKKCSTELPANEPSEMYRDEARSRRHTFALDEVLQFQLGIITLSLQAGVVPARTRHMQDRKWDDGMIFDAEGNKHKF